MPAFAQQVFIHFAQQWREGIRVFLDPCMITRRKAQTIVETLTLLEFGGEEAFRMDTFEFADLPVVGLGKQPDACCRRGEDVHPQGLLATTMDAEDAERVAVPAAHDRLDVTGHGRGISCGHAASPVSSSRSPAIGISHQVGRLASSYMIS